jgi:hypothetical protein
MRVNWPGRHTAIGLDVQRVGDGAFGRAKPLLWGEDVSIGQVGAELIGDKLRGVRPVTARGDRRAHAGRELLGLGAG